MESGFRGFGEDKRSLREVILLFCVLESEVAGAGVAVVVELLLDVDHVAAGIFQLSELGSTAEVSKVAELWQP